MIDYVVLAMGLYIQLDGCEPAWVEYTASQDWIANKREIIYLTGIWHLSRLEQHNTLCRKWPHS